MWRLAILRKRQDFAPCANFVAIFCRCRNNSENISPKYLESAEICRIFAHGGKVTIQDILKSTTAILMFP